jgi:hypothetical protein
VFRSLKGSYYDKIGSLLCFNSALLHQLIQLLSSDFKLQNLGVIHYFWGLRSILLVWDSCYDKYILDILHRAGMSSYKPIDTLISTFKVTVLPDYLFSDPTQFWLLVLFNISLLQDQIFVLLLIRSVSLYILLSMHIGLPLNALCVILKVWFLLAYISSIAPHLLYMVL